MITLWLGEKPENWRKRNIIPFYKRRTQGKRKDGQPLFDPWEDDGEAHFANVFQAREVQENQ